MLWFSLQGPRENSVKVVNVSATISDFVVVNRNVKRLEVSKTILFETKFCLI